MNDIYVVINWITGLQLFKNWEHFGFYSDMAEIRSQVPTNVEIRYFEKCY